MREQPSNLTARSQLRQLDTLLRAWRAPRRPQSPERGWIAAIREALGMTQRDFARRAGMHATIVRRLEEREQEQTVTLATLARAANALECDLVYALIPRQGTLRRTLESRARQIGLAETRSVADTMALEDQTLVSEEMAAQQQDVESELLRGSWARLWQPLQSENETRRAG